MTGLLHSSHDGVLETRPARQLGCIFGVQGLSLSTVFAKVSTWVIDAEDANGADHWQTFENPKEPFCAESIAVHTFGKLADTVDASNLSRSACIFLFP